MKSSFNPLRLVSAPPPPHHQLRPLFSESSLIVTLVNPAHGIQGCPKIISFDKNYRHFDFWRIFFSLLFLCCFTPVHFSQHPLPKKCTPFFLPIINPRILFPLSSSLQFLPFLNKCANYSCRRIFETSLLTLLDVSLVLWRRKADNAHSNPLFYGPRP